MPKLKQSQFTKEVEVEEEVEQVEVVKESVKVEKKLREVILSGVTINSKQPWLQLGDPNPDVIVDVRPDGMTSCGRYIVVDKQWVRFRG